MFRAARAIAQRISTLTVASVVALSSLATAAPLFFSNTASALPGGQYQLELDQDMITVEAGTGDVELYSFAEFRLCTFFFGCTGWNDFVGESTTPTSITASVTGAEVSSDGITWGASKTVTTVPFTKAGQEFRFRSAAAGTFQVHFQASIMTTEGLRSLTAAATLTATDASAPVIENLSLNRTPTNEASVTVSGTVTDNDLKEYRYQIVNAAKQNTLGSYSWSKIGGTTSVVNSTLFTADLRTQKLDGVNVAPLPDGNYYVRVWASDKSNNNAGNAVQYYLPFRIDTARPMVSIKTSANAESGSLGTHPVYSRISFKLTDPGTDGKLREVVLNGHSYARNTRTNDLNWVNIQKSHLIEGENVVYTVDAAGNKSDELTFTYDKTAPTAAVTYSNTNPTRGNIYAYLTPSESVQITSTNWESRPDGTFRKAYSPNSDTPNWDQTVEFKDAAGNVGTAHVYIDWLDNSQPLATLDPQPAFVSGTVNITGSVSDNLGLSHYNLSLYPGDADLTSGDALNSQRIEVAGGWTTGGQTNVNGTNASVSRALDTTLLADGTYQVRLGAADAAGNKGVFGESVVVISFTIDNTNPGQFALLTPADGASLTSSSFEKFDWEDATDTNSVTYSMLLYKDGEWVPSAGGLTDSEWTPALPLEEGNYGWRVWATDAAGNETWTESRSFAINNTVVLTPDDDNGRGGEFVAPATPPTGTEGGTIASRATTNDGSRVLAANATSQTNGQVQAAETTTDDSAVDGAVDEDDEKLVEDTSSVFDYWWIILLVLIGLFWFIVAKRRKNEE